MENRFPLILSDRKEHLNLLSEEIKRHAAELPITEFILSGEMSKKARKKALDDIQSALNDSQRPYILSTGSLIGEGFDLPELDTLIIAMPFSFKGRVVQYAGRLHRQNIGKTDALIYDYLDINSGLMISMFKKRLTAYKEMEYKIEALENIKILKFLKHYKSTKKNNSAELFSI
jgi:superfamily II DNA or RNA helicase